MIELKNISKIYESDVFRTEALKNINLKIEKGEFVSIMGDSGSGKSTLLRIMGGLDIPTDGEYWYMDTPLDFSNRKMMDAFRNQNIGYIFQNFELMERYTVYENIEMPLICRNIPKKKRKELIQHTASRFGIQDLLQKYPSQISGGQQQRTAIARTIVMNTPVILADEPTGALDYDNSISFMEELLKLNKEGKTIVMVTHNKALAERTHRMIQISDGELY